MNKKLLIELRKLQRERSTTNPFPSYNDFLIWSDAVAPLLNFDESIKRRFSQTLLSAKVTETMSPKDHINNVNECVGIVNEGIQQLEHNIAPPKNREEKNNVNADSFTDLFFSSSNKIKLLILGALFAVFTAGVTLGQSQLYAKYLAPLLFSLDETAIEVDENKNI